MWLRILIIILLCLLQSLNFCHCFDMENEEMIMELVEKILAEKTLALSKKVRNLETAVLNQQTRITYLERQERRSSRMIIGMQKKLTDIRTELKSNKEIMNDAVSHNSDSHADKYEQTEFDYDRNTSIASERSSKTARLSTRGNARGFVQSRQSPEIVAFSAWLSHNIGHMGIGHHVVFDKVLTNDGAGYNANTGIFTVPVTGLYLFTYSVNDHYVKTMLQLVVDGSNMVDIIVDPDSSTEVHMIIVIVMYYVWLCLWIHQVYPVKGVTPSSILESLAAESTRLDLVKQYFYCGFTYTEIVLLFFVTNNIKISLRQLNRVLKKNNLRRRIGYTPDHIVADYISKEIETSGQCIGYRSMWKRLVNEHRLRIPRNKVLSIMKTIDPDGITFRKAHRLKRRKYQTRGPNYVWHVDGYDKLKPYGFCIHGAIDGYSRRILWLEVSESNNNPAGIAMYYIETLKTLGVAPRILRCDKGTENSTLSLLQPFFRYNDTDSMSGLRSFKYGKSVSNQRIEAWWGTMRRQGIQWWIHFFKDLKDSNEYDELNPLHVECLKFCFMYLIQAELDRIAVNWNLHFIRKQRNAEVPNGKPDLMYFVPEVFGGHDFGKIVNQQDVELCCEMYGLRRTLCSKEFQDLAKLLKPDLRIQVTVQGALDLYRELLELIEEIME